MGEPGDGYPWRWSILRWLDGEPASRANVADASQFAKDLADFLRALRRAEAAAGPPAGRHNFFRGGPVATYDREVREAIAGLAGRINSGVATAVWEKALATTWERPPVWVHGDVSASNILVRDGRLAAVIDFGSSGVGDPACDLAMAWTFFARSERKTFREGVEMDPSTWMRARGWALWKALILMHREDGPESAVRDSWRVFREVLGDEPERN
jgi:aminoglycoside phosphotransferase (APT) family kinase protein